MKTQKLLALAQHLNLEVFEFQGEHYTGATQIEIDEMELTEAENFISTECSPLEDTIEGDEDIFEAEGNEYLVYTDSEADQAFEDSIDSYIDDCVLPEIPENYRNYFDRCSFTEDCKLDGRGHTLSPYDGEENEETLDNREGRITYYIYRTN